MLYLYLDQNIYIKAISNEIIKQKILSLKKHEIKFVYSPAHIEEIYTAITRKSSYIDVASKLFALLSETTDNLECIPSIDSGVVQIIENPKVCYDRVKSFDTTDVVASHANEKYIYDKKNYKNLINADKHNKNISTLSCEEIWSHPSIFKSINELNVLLSHVKSLDNFEYRKESTLYGFSENLRNLNNIFQGCFSLYKNSFFHLQNYIELLFRILNQNGFNSEKSEKTSASGIHDVSHALYATKANLLLTEDKRFYKKCKAVYFYLGVPTKVILCDDSNLIGKLDGIALRKCNYSDPLTDPE